MTVTPAPARPLLLVTNDDGVAAAGLWDLAGAVAGLGDLAVVAPAREQSWTGRAHRSDPGGGDGLRSVVARPHPAPAGVDDLRCCLAVAATPARCVRLALDGLGLRPALVVSGVNPGSNVGGLVTASGTLGAAWEAAGDGIPAVAFSRPERTAAGQQDALHAQVRRVVERVLAVGLPAGAAVLNVNLPADVRDDTGWAVTTTATASVYGHRFTPSAQDDGSTVWGLEFVLREAGHADPGSDLAALREGAVSLTFLPARHGMSVTW